MTVTRRCWWSKEITERGREEKAERDELVIWRFRDEECEEGEENKDVRKKNIFFFYDDEDVCVLLRQ